MGNLQHRDFGILASSSMAEAAGVEKIIPLVSRGIALP